MATINDVCDYIISKIAVGPQGLSLLKLQKLMYYCQAWRLAFGKGPLFPNKFQAWVHGPVNREIYDRFKDNKFLYSPVTHEDILESFAAERMSVEERGHIDAVLEVYGKFTGDQLESMTHREEPWVAARGGIPLHQRCENELNEELMGAFFGARLKKTE